MTEPTGSEIYSADKRARQRGWKDRTCECRDDTAAALLTRRKYREEVLVILSRCTAEYRELRWALVARVGVDSLLANC